MTMHGALRIAPLQGSVSAAEWQARVDLAACYRLCESYGMSDMIYTHITARVPDSPGHFLINPNGMLFGEITASSLLKVSLEGEILYKPDLPYGLHPAGFTIHSAIYRARPDAMAAMHTHTVAGMAVSALKCGLLPLTQTATRFYGRIAYHEFRGPERDPSERDSLARSIGKLDYCILRNHGLLTLGESVPEAFIAMWGLERACQAQLQAMACNTELNLPPDDVVAKSCEMYTSGSRRYGLLEWPGLLRKLDMQDPSYRD
ncbi:class II aldolase/adducin family protein [Siccirubricoccus sp. KC 17139]|uniref:Class II aldolase/adducin family protein n=1 Tax=Siccirubricoccus soli TaxID=2899147 RepID=A0ABT1D9H2_9PROT|nr:class II aldolase/adducin family protein [Siccirubricoccus soli]MCO6418588.1 class II aldolase/adducin family protein [Siccirubricoccus soli]MCP2684723.1 class II aldolase/adducin family protein [Siccirubricoccus soli]